MSSAVRALLQCSAYSTLHPPTCSPTRTSTHTPNRPLRIRTLDDYDSNNEFREAMKGLSGRASVEWHCPPSHLPTDLPAFLHLPACAPTTAGLPGRVSVERHRRLDRCECHPHRWVAGTEGQQAGVRRGVRQECPTGRVAFLPVGHSCLPAYPPPSPPASPPIPVPPYPKHHTPPTAPLKQLSL